MHASELGGAVGQLPQHVAAELLASSWEGEPSEQALIVVSLPYWSDLSDLRVGVYQCDTETVE